MIAPDVERLVRLHHNRLVWGGVALVIACPLIGLVIGLVVWGWLR